MNDLAPYSDAFIRSQVDYYRRHLSPLYGNWHDRNLIRGLLLSYENELRRRQIG